jgi:hypothetical protein
MVVMVSLEGMYDLHIHPAPSIRRRRFNAIEALQLAHKEKMAGLLFVDHTYNTQMVADTVNGMGLFPKAFGAIILNEAVGGLNLSVVESALSLGTKQIEMPTYSSKAHYDVYGDEQKKFPYKIRVKPTYLLNDKGQLINAVEEILEVMKDKGSFLGTGGHLSTPEVDALVGRATALGIRVLVNSVSTDKLRMPLDAQKRWAGDYVFLEHTYMAIHEANDPPMSIGTLVEQIRGIGAEYCVLATDAGGMQLPDNVTAIKNFVERLLESGITEKEIDLMTRENPKILMEIS